MLSPNHLVSVFCLLALFILTSVQAQDEPKQVPSLDDAQTMDDVTAWLRQDVRSGNRADANIAAGKKLLEIAQNAVERSRAYNMMFAGFRELKTASGTGIEVAERKIEALFAELAAKEETKEIALAEQFRFGFIRMNTMNQDGILGSSKHIEREIETLIEELAAKSEDERNKVEDYILHQCRFLLIAIRLHEVKPSHENYAENYGTFVSELKTLINKGHARARDITSLGFQAAGRNKVRHKTFIEELVAFVGSPDCTLSDKEKEQVATLLEGTIRLNIGSDPKLYGKTLDNTDFDWESLRGKYVLINFTGTWCGPCKEKIPLLLDAYEKYHGRGLEIVQVYVGERDDDPVATVKEFVEAENLPWIIISAALSEEAGFPLHGLSYHTPTVPVMVLVNKEGEIIVSNESGLWLAKLNEILDDVHCAVGVGLCNTEQERSA